MNKRHAQKWIRASLLDRLSQEDHRKTYDDKRLQHSVTQNLHWLLDTVALSSDPTMDLSPYELVQSSIINYGVPDFVGSLADSQDIKKLQTAITTAIKNFEPRIIPDSLSVSVRLNHTGGDTIAEEHSELVKTGEHFMIALSGYIWSQPTNLAFSLIKHCHINHPEEGSLMADHIY